jgi:hypothetical protein
MSKKVKKGQPNVVKVAKAIGGTVDKFSDNSLSWVNLENDKFRINICFDGIGEKFDHIIIAEKIYTVVDEKTIATIK